MTLSSPVTSIPGIGNSLSARLENLGISTVFDLLYHLPFRFEDRRTIRKTVFCHPGETVTVLGTITSIKNDFTHSGKFIQKAVLTDETGDLDVTWFNQTFLVKALKNRIVSLSGKVEFFGRKKTLISPDYEFADSGTQLIHTGRLVPVYPETAGISSKLLRTKLFSLIHHLDFDDFLPETYGLLPWKQALINAHFPNDPDDTLPARNRLAFDELVLLQLAALIHRRTWNQTRLTHSLRIDQGKIDGFIASLPFTLTSSQQSAVADILSDLSSSHPMNRLLEGDVGSGKTVIAAIAAFVTHLNGFQTIIMAPTQILANQHFQTISSLLSSFQIPVSLITSASRVISTSPNAGVIIGTHALISDKNAALLQNSGLIVIDEQHRFGVAQRELAGKLGVTPHILTMTATPIPRTIALTMFKDLELSFLSDKPIGRLPIKTWVIPETKRDSSYTWIKSEILSTRHQVIWVCPFIEDNDTSVTVKAATSEFARLQDLFPEFKLGLLHGKLKSKEKDQIISDFRSGKIHILVATPVVEVGLDIPNAGIMVIEGAERFGLAQLHQLRGRVGRSSHQSYCLLFTSDGSVPQRLKSMENFDSGRQLSEIDLQLRGPGDIYGTKQHGFPQFKVANYENPQLIALSQQAAEQLYPRLEQLRVLRDLLKEDKIALTRPN